MSGEVLFPVFVLAKDCGEVTEYPTLTAMQGYMEAVDVEGDEYEAWDTNGNVVQLTVATPGAGWLRFSGMDQRLPEGELAELKAKAKLYRQPEPLLRSVRRVLFGR